MEADTEKSASIPPDSTMTEALYLHTLVRVGRYTGIVGREFCVDLHMGRRIGYDRKSKQQTRGVREARGRGLVEALVCLCASTLKLKVRLYAPTLQLSMEVYRHAALMS